MCRVIRQRLLDAQSILAIHSEVEAGSALTNTNAVAETETVLTLRAEEPCGAEHAQEFRKVVRKRDGICAKLRSYLRIAKLLRLVEIDNIHR